MAGKKRASLIGKMTAWFISVILLFSSALAVVLYASSSTQYYNDLVEDNYAILGILSESILDKTTMVETSIELLSYDTDVLSLLNTKGQSLYERIIKQRYNVQELINQTKTPLFSLSPEIVLFSVTTDVPVSYFSFMNINDAALTPDYQRFVQTGRSRAWVGEGLIYPDHLFIHKEENRVLFCFYQNIYAGLGEIVGVLKCGVQTGKLFSSIELEDSGAALYVVQEDKSIHSTAQAPELPAGINIQMRQQMINGQLYLSKHLEKLGVYLVMCVEKGHLLRKALVSGLPQLAAALGSCILILLMTKRFLRTLQRRIDQAVAFTNQARDGCMDIVFPEKDDSEIGQLIESFNVLLNRLQSKAVENIAHEKSEKRAMRLALQYQVNPHFLFNSLNWIQMEVELGAERDRISEAITLLGRLLRYNLEEQATSSLQEELDSTRTYVRLMNMRKHDVVSLHTYLQNVPSELRLIRFLFQPVCENAIQHGVIAGRRLHIVIRGRAEEGWIFFDIENDGAMIPPERLERLDIESREAQSRGGVGLANLLARLRLLYGEEACLRVDSTEKSTCIHIAFPSVQTNEKEDEHAASDRR